MCTLLMPAGKASKQLDALTMDDRVTPEKTPALTSIYPIMQKMCVALHPSPLSAEDG